MGRDKERPQKAAVDAGVETVDNTVDAGTGQRFTSRGDRPTVQPDLFHPQVSASDQAYDQSPTNAGPGLRIVIGMFDKGIDTTSISISSVIVHYPDEREAIVAFIVKQRGMTFAADCTDQADKANADKKKQKGVHIGGGGLDFGGSTLAPTIRPPLPTLSTSTETDSHQNAEAANAKRQEQRSLDPNKDKPHNPIVDGVMRLRNPEMPTAEQQSIDEKIKAALAAGRADGGT